MGTVAALWQQEAGWEPWRAREKWGWDSPYGKNSSREGAELSTFTLVPLPCPQHKAQKGEEREGMGGCYHVWLLLIAVGRYFKGIPCLILSFRTPEGPPEYRLGNGREIGPTAFRGSKGASYRT